LHPNKPKNRGKEKQLHFYHSKHKKTGKEFRELKKAENT
jgi:hypothetical protein